MTERESRRYQTCESTQRNHKILADGGPII